MIDDDLDGMLSALGRAEPAPAIDAAAILARAATLVPAAPPTRGLAGARLGAVLAGTSFMSALLGVLGALFFVGHAPARLVPVRVPVPVLVATPAPGPSAPAAPPLAALERAPASPAIPRRLHPGVALMAAGSCPALGSAEPDTMADLDLGFEPELGAPPALVTPPEEHAQVVVPGLAPHRRADAVRLVGGFEGLHPQVAAGFVHRGAGRSSWYADGELRVVPVPPTEPTMMDMQGPIRTWPLRVGGGAGLTAGGDKVRFEAGWTLAFGVTTADGLARAAVANGPQLGVTVGALDQLHGRLAASVLFPVASQGDPEIAGTGGVELPLGRRARPGGASATPGPSDGSR